jgi:hypothetical protein
MKWEIVLQRFYAASASVWAASPTSRAGSRTANTSVEIVVLCSLFGIVVEGLR